MKVETIPEEERIDPEDLDKLLAKEARHYLWKVLNYELPSPHGRLYVPVIDTPERRMLMDTRRDPVERFINDFIEEVDGESIDAAEFRGEFNQWLHENLGVSMGREKLYQSLRLLPNSIQHNYASKNKGVIQNARWKKRKGHKSKDAKPSAEERDTNSRTTEPALTA